MASTCFNIHLRPTVAIKNCLPVDLICCGQNIATEILVKAGETIQLPNANPGNSYVVIRVRTFLLALKFSIHFKFTQPMYFLFYILI